MNMGNPQFPPSYGQPNYGQPNYNQNMMPNPNINLNMNPMNPMNPMNQMPNQFGMNVKMKGFLPGCPKCNGTGFNHKKNKP